MISRKPMTIATLGMAGHGTHWTAFVISVPRTTGGSVMSGDKQTAIAGLVCALFLSHAVAQTPPVTPSPELERLSSVRLLQRSQVLNQMRETISARLKD